MGSETLSCDGTLTPKPALTLSGNSIRDNNMSVNARIRQMEALVLMLGVSWPGVVQSNVCGKLENTQIIRLNCLL